MNHFKNRGFSLIEIIIVLFILVIIVAISVPNIRSLIEIPQLNNTSEEVINILKLAQNQTLSSQANSQYGVYFNTTTTPHQYVLFKGTDYTTRDSSFDLIYQIPNIEFYAVNTGGNNEVVFDKLTGATENSGSVSLRLADDNSQNRTIYVDNSGVVGFNPLSVPADTRLKDSRHIDFNYSRTIDTANENIVLTFDGNVVETIPMNLYLSTGQFYWQGTTNANGQNQVVTIETLRLNSPDTQFSIYRDLRFNNKSLTVKISGDTTGTLAGYFADGLTTNFSSIYVNNFAWQ